MSGPTDPTGTACGDTPTEGGGGPLANLAAKVAAKIELIPLLTYIDAARAVFERAVLVGGVYTPRLKGSVALMIAFKLMVTSAKRAKDEADGGETAADDAGDEAPTAERQATTEETEADEDEEVTVTAVNVGKWTNVPLLAYLDAAKAVLKSAAPVAGKYAIQLAGVRRFIRMFEDIVTQRIGNELEIDDEGKITKETEGILQTLREAEAVEAAADEADDASAGVVSASAAVEDTKLPGGGSSL